MHNTEAFWTVAYQAKAETLSSDSGPKTHATIILITIPDNMDAEDTEPDHCDNESVNTDASSESEEGSMSSYEDDDESESSSEGSLSSREVLVSFSANARVRDIPNLDCYSQAELQSMFYSKDEFMFMRRTRKMLMDRMNREENFAIMDHNSHGLYTQEQDTRRQAIVWNAQLAVMTEQQFQQEDDVHDDESISHIYYECTSLCQWEAIQRAKLLARLVEEEIENKDIDDDCDVIPSESFHGSFIRSSPRTRRKGPRSKCKSLPESAPPAIAEEREEEELPSHSTSATTTNTNKVAFLHPAFAKRVRAPAPRPVQRGKSQSLPGSYRTKTKNRTT